MHRPLELADLQIHWVTFYGYQGVYHVIGDEVLHDSVGYPEGERAPLSELLETIDSIQSETVPEHERLRPGDAQDKLDRLNDAIEGANR